MLAADRNQISRLSGGRPRSTSGSSAVLLNRAGLNEGRASVGLESASNFGVGGGGGGGGGAGSGGGGHDRSASGSAYTPTTPGASTPFSYMPSEGHDLAPSDPYYRPPRTRRPTMEGYSPGARSRHSWVTGDVSNRRWSQTSRDRVEPAARPAGGPSGSGRATPVPAYLGPRELSDVNVNDPRWPHTDYAVREVDFYYGVRGPALSAMPTRRLGTGPADPTGPIASAAGWVMNLFGGKTKEKGKGFEVVRSSRVPPPMGPRVPSSAQPRGPPEPYTDDARQQSDAGGGQATRHAAALVDIESAADEHSVTRTAMGDSRSLRSASASDESDVEQVRPGQISPVAPSLPRIDTGGGIELPSRIGSRASSRHPHTGDRRAIPAVPRKSSKRTSLPLVDIRPHRSQLLAVRSSPPGSPGDPQRERVQGTGGSDNSFHMSSGADPHGIGPSGSSSPRLPFGSEQSSVRENALSTEGGSRSSSVLPPLESDINPTNVETVSTSRQVVPRVEERPTSMGFVTQHRAYDHIHAGLQVESGVDLQGRAAELVQGHEGRGSIGPGQTYTF